MGSQLAAELQEKWNQRGVGVHEGTHRIRTVRVAKLASKNGRRLIVTQDAGCHDVQHWLLVRGHWERSFRRDGVWTIYTRLHELELDRGWLPLVGSIQLDLRSPEALKGMLILLRKSFFGGQQVSHIFPFPEVSDICRL